MTEVPVILCDDWSDAQVKAFRLLVNRSVNWAARVKGLGRVGPHRRDMAFSSVESAHIILFGHKATRRQDW